MMTPASVTTWMRCEVTSAFTTWRRPISMRSEMSSAPYAPSPNGTPYSLALTLTLVPAG
ncbi:Uncharacterised protein [Mycobacterium tuberculosis]|nr:Uncharacterised protein [Mycobacterium tuberculosis]